VKARKGKKRQHRASRSAPKRRPTHTKTHANRTKRRDVKHVSSKSTKAKDARARNAKGKKGQVGQKGKAGVSRARATTPARSTHVKSRPQRVPSPMPLRHEAPPRPVLVTPARSMPPARDARKLTPAPARSLLAVPDFSEAGIILAITYSIREGRRGEFFDLMRELKPMLATIGGTDCTVYEDRTRPNYFMEVFRFKDEAEFTAFDDKFHKDRKIAAIYALLDDIVEAEKSDFKIFERRL
jgi:hypothetical protein